MAKILIEFDTNEKTLAATIDGKPVDNVVEVSFCVGYDDKDEYRCCLMTKETNDEHDIQTYTHLRASESIDAKGVDASPSDIAGFVKSDAGNSLRQAIANYFE
jgi:hypothetical protein